MSARFSVPVIRYSKPDADDDEGRADRAHDQVLVRGHERSPVAAERDQHVGRERRHLEEHEDVERVARDRDAEQARQAQREHRVEEVVLLAARPPSRCWRGCTAARPPRLPRHQHQHERAEPVDAVLDAPRRRPVADGVGDRAAVGHAAATARPRSPARSSSRPATVANARPRRRTSTVSGAAISGTTTCSAGRCWPPGHCSCGDGSGVASCFRRSSSSMLP